MGAAPAPVVQPRVVPSPPTMTAPRAPQPPKRPQPTAKSKDSNTFFVIIGVILLVIGMVVGGIVLMKAADHQPSSLAMNPKLKAREDAKLAQQRKEKEAQEAEVATAKKESQEQLAKLMGDERAAAALMTELEAIRVSWQSLTADADSNNDPKDLRAYWTAELEKRVETNSVLRHWLGGKPVRFLAEMLWGEEDDGVQRGKLADFLASGGYKGTGSGFFVSGDGWIVTNHHVVDDAQNVEVRGQDGVIRKAVVVKTDPVADLALLKTELTPEVWMPLASSDATMGTSVFTIGFPHADIQGVEPKFTDGRISSLSGIRDDAASYQISVPVQPGNSGGPLVDLKSGAVVGVVCAKLSADVGAENVNYAVKGSLLQKLIADVSNAQKAVATGSSPTASDEAQVIARARGSVVMILVK